MCTNPPKDHPAVGTALWNPPFTTTLFSSAGLLCTLPFPGLKAGELSRAERCGARSGPADESEPRPRPVEDDLHSRHSYCISSKPESRFSTD